MIEREALNIENPTAEILASYLDHPLSDDAEAAFEQVLLSQRWLTVALSQAIGHRTDELLTANERLTLGALTYLADGQRYLPVFSDNEGRDRYIDAHTELALMPDLQCSIASLMQEGKEAGLHGVILDPGRANIPVTYDYWSSLAANEVLQLPPVQPLQSDRRAITARLTRLAKQTPRLRKIWGATIRRKAEALPQLIVVAEFQGSQQTFDHEYAEKLSEACLPSLRVGQELMIGTTQDPLGAKVASMVAPLYLI